LPQVTTLTKSFDFTIAWLPPDVNILGVSCESQVRDAGVTAQRFPFPRAEQPDHLQPLPLKHHISKFRMVIGATINGHTAAQACRITPGTADEGEAN
jgi:hypothetical protein